MMEDLQIIFRKEGVKQGDFSSIRIHIFVVEVGSQILDARFTTYVPAYDSSLALIVRIPTKFLTVFSR